MTDTDINLPPLPRYGEGPYRIISQSTGDVLTVAAAEKWARAAVLADRAERAPVVPPGYVLVPIEPTPEMLNTFKLPGESDEAWVDRITGASQPAPPQGDAAQEIAHQLRAACLSVRSKSYPLADLIPLMQQAADELSTSTGATP